MMQFIIAPTLSWGLAGNKLGYAMLMQLWLRFSDS